MNAAQETEPAPLRLRVATSNDVTCRIVRRGKGSYDVYVGNRKESFCTYNRLKDAKRYIANRAESDAKAAYAIEIREKAARLKAEGARKLPRFSTGWHGFRVAWVAGMEVTARELRCEVDGGRAWEIYLERNSIGHVTEFSTNRVAMHHNTSRETSQQIGYGELAKVAERLTNKVLHDAFFA
jgi:hypothetical protein